MLSFWRKKDLLSNVIGGGGQKRVGGEDTDDDGGDAKKFKGLNDFKAVGSETNSKNLIDMKGGKSFSGVEPKKIKIKKNKRRKRTLQLNKISNYFNNLGKVKDVSFGNSLGI